MEDQRVRLFLPLLDEVVVLEVPRVEPTARLKMYDAVQLPFPPAYDPSGQGIVEIKCEPRSV